MERSSGEEVAVIQGKLEPTLVFPDAVYKLSVYFNEAEILVERNNHGIATLARLDERGANILNGPDDKPGYNKSASSKVHLWDIVVGELRAVYLSSTHDPDSCPSLVRDAVTHAQVSSLEASTCKAPKGDHDDMADAWGLAQYARSLDSGTPNWRF